VSFDVSDIVKVKGNKFYLTERVAPRKSVSFKTDWKGGRWFFEADVDTDGTTLHLTCIGSMNSVTKV
jgi:hypothetical protein